MSEIRVFSSGSGKWLIKPQDNDKYCNYISNIEKATVFTDTELFNAYNTYVDFKVFDKTLHVKFDDQVKLVKDYLESRGFSVT